MPQNITLTANQVKAIPLSAIELDPENIRKTFDEASLKELAADIKLRGLEQPIVVTKNGSGKYRVKHGERRYRAVKLNKAKTIDCILGKEEKGEDAEFQRLASQWAENMLREDLNPIDVAEFFKTCRDEFGMTAKQIPDYLKEYGIKCEYNESTIRGMIRLVELPAWAKDLIKAGKLSQSHGRAMLPAIKSPNVMKDLRKEIEEDIKRMETTPAEELAPYEMVTVNGVMELVNSLFDHYHPKASTFKYQHLSDDFPGKVSYDISKLDKETLEKLNTVEVTDEDGDRETYILNTQLHQQLQKEAIANKKKNAGNKQSSSSASPGSSTSKSTGNGKEDKPEPKTEASAERLQNWLHRYLAKWCLQKLDTLNVESRNALFERILIWCAVDRPGNYSVAYMDNNFYETVLDILKLDDFNSFIHSDIAIEKVQNITAETLLTEMEGNQAFCNIPLSFHNVVALANYLQFNIDKDIAIDADFAEMYTGAGCEKIVHQAKLQDNQVWKEAKKTAQKREYLVTAAAEIGTPQAVKQLWKDTLPE